MPTNRARIWCCWDTPNSKRWNWRRERTCPRQKIYEVLDSLVEKGFAQVVQEKTKLFSAVEPSLAIPGYLARKRQMLEQELTDNGPRRRRR